MSQLLLLLGSGLLAGGMNALAGGGSFVTIAALIAAGVPSVNANASSTVALYPGGASSAWVYRAGPHRVCGLPVTATFATTVSGGLVGALLLLWTPSGFFDRLLPWLLLIAALVLCAGPRLGPWLRARVEITPPALLAVQALLGVYGGYFGGAVGLMMMAAWSLLGDADVKALTAPRTLFVTAANTTAVICFALAHIVFWPETLTVGAGAVVGGYAGAHIGRRLPPALVRRGTIALTIALTAVFFARAYGR